MFFFYYSLRVPSRSSRLIKLGGVGKSSRASLIDKRWQVVSNARKNLEWLLGDMQKSWTRDKGLI